MVEFAQQAAARNESAPLSRIYASAAQSRQVDLHAAITGALAAVAMAAAFHGDDEVMTPSEIDGSLDVRDSRRLDDQRGILVDPPIEDATSLVVAGIAGQK
jgi:hypothetical protein